MQRKSIMLDMDEVIVKGRFTEFLDEFLGGVDFEKLNEYYDIYIVTSYVWKENVIDAAENLKNKYEYLKHFLPFIDTNNFIFITNKTKIKFDIGIDDRPKNLNSCDQKLLFTEFRNKKISEEELQKDNIIRVNNWLDIQKILIENK